ncbi:hypothetical protein BpHYR1_019133 [Brachionus plicatilis]|uniref:Uncharacterized protein n=1 Tax=Brachionus plicatilis TaxID=10195 RepID=A0A3M7RHF6_BRAPC|nr:hypothetical protein BpHYR1_019133 [Brachionus plicatilis]
MKKSHRLSLKINDVCPYCIWAIYLGPEVTELYYRLVSKRCLRYGKYDNDYKEKCILFKSISQINYDLI